jgi:ABC-type dipeptide/oligopeptide/nickel transport system permease subunit
MESIDITSLELEPRLAVEEVVAGMTPGRRLLHRLAQPTLIAGLLMIFIAVLVAVFAPLIARYDPTTLTANLLSPPSSTNFFGTDELGRDLFSRVVYASRVSLAVAFGAVALAAFAGGLLGVVSGYFGRWVDIGIMRVLDVLFAFPAILFAVSLVAALGPSIRNLILTIAILYTPRFARVARGPTLTVKERDFVTSARALGAGNGHIIRAHIVPNVMSPLVVEISLSLTIAVLTEAALSFLGLGVQPPDPSWGGMISAARPYLLQAPWYVLFPGLSIMYCVLAFNFLGDGLHDALNPNLDSR